MENYQIHFAGLSPTLSTVGLVSTYNSHIYGYYNNPPIIINSSFQKKKRDMYCVLVTLDGNANILLHNEQIVPLKKKSIFFSKYSEIAQIQHRGTHWHFVCYWFVSQNINLPVNETYYLPNMNVEKEDAKASHIIRLVQTQIPHKVQYANSYFCCHLLNILEKIQHNGQDNQEFIEQTLTYIHQHIENNIQVKDLAIHFHFSEKHIHHLFKKMFNNTPRKFINYIKLTYVEDLLKHSTISLQELTEKYKYASTSHLIKCFKQQYGTTPTEYRKS